MVVVDRASHHYERAEIGQLHRFVQCTMEKIQDSNMNNFAKPVVIVVRACILISRLGSS